MLKTWTTTSVISTLVAFSSIAYSDTLVKFSDLPRLIEQNAVDVKEQRLVEKAAAPVNSVATTFLPKIELGTSQAQEDGVSTQLGEISSSLNLYRGGKDALAAEIEKREAVIAALETKQVINTTLVRSYQLYSQLVALINHGDTIATLEKNLLSSKDIVRRRQSRGQSPDSDGYKIDLEMLKLAAEKNNTAREINIIKLELSRLIGVQDFSVEKNFSILERDLKAIEKIQLDQTPAMASLVQQGNMLNAKAQLSQRAWFPDIDVFAEREHDFGASEHAESLARTQFGLRFAFDLESTAKSRQDVARANAEKELVELRKQSLTQKHQDAITLLKADIASFQEKAANAQATLQLAEKLANAIVKEFQGGVKDIEEVVAAQWGFYEASHTAIDVQESYANRLTEIMALIP